MPMPFGDQILKVDKPWGGFLQVAQNEPCTVKILTVSPGESTSLQSHRNRDELWIVLDEGLEVEVDGLRVSPKPGETVAVPRMARHRLSCPGPRPARILEVSFGTFNEEDITRYEDRYGRV